MSAQLAGTIEHRPLEILGIRESEEQAYRWLLLHPGATADDLTQELGIASAEGPRLLGLLESKGLATHSPEQPRRYLPVSPDIAIEAIVRQHEGEIQRARAAAAEMQKEMARTGNGWERTIELITNPDAERQIFEQIQRVAEREVLSLVRPPILISRLEVPYEEDQRTQAQAQRRGVSYRGIVDAEFLAMPGAIGRVRGDIASGEELRVFPHLPFKMGLADRRIALIPLNLEQPRGPSLVVRTSALLDALYALFEILWERAVPIAMSADEGAIETGEPQSGLPEGTADLLPLMAAGLKDKAMAYELGISSSTLTRRVTELMHSLDVRTRFQLGWVAAMRHRSVRNTEAR